MDKNEGISSGTVAGPAYTESTQRLLSVASQSLYCDNIWPMAPAILEKPLTQGKISVALRCAPLRSIGVTSMANLKPISMTEAREYFGCDFAGQHHSIPLVWWAGGRPWTEANIWALHLVRQGEPLEELFSVMGHLSQYAVFLEKESLSWDSFPLDFLEQPPIRLWLHLAEWVAVDPEDEPQVSDYLLTVSSFYWFGTNSPRISLTTMARDSIRKSIGLLEGFLFLFISPTGHHGVDIVHQMLVANNSESEKRN